MSVEILVGDCRQLLATMPEESVHTIVSSPPYMGLRDYKHPDQIGREPSVEEFVQALVLVFREARRVLRRDGTLWLNLGETYAGSWGNQGQRNSRSLMSANQRAAAPEVASMAGAIRAPGIKPKDMYGIPWRVAFALQADGWWLRQDIIWSKLNPMPESVSDRCTKAHEYLFLLSRAEDYFFDAAAIAEPIQSDRAPSRKAKKTGAGRPQLRGGSPYDGTGEFRNKRSVWEIAAQPFSGEFCSACRSYFQGETLAALRLVKHPYDPPTRFCTCGRSDAWVEHFATFPPALIEPCILAGSPKFACGCCGIAIDPKHATEIAITKGRALAPMRMVRGESHPGSEKPGPQILQQALRVEMDGEEPMHNERPNDQLERLCPASSSGPSASVEGRLHSGTSPRDGREAWATTPQDGGRASPRRKPRQQCAGEPGSPDEDRSRQVAEKAHRGNQVSPLRPEDNPVAVCPNCKAALDEVGVRPGVVLDVFGGAGTTGLVADRNGRDARLIELNPDYAEMAAGRIRAEARMFAQVTLK